MSFDIFLQGFRSGDATTMNASTLFRILEPFLVDGGEVDPHLRFADGVADIHGFDHLASGVMINHASGRLVWDLIFDIADGAGLAIMPVGCATAVTEEAALADLPPELRESAVVVRSGGELLRLIEMS